LRAAVTARRDGGQDEGRQGRQDQGGDQQGAAAAPRAGGSSPRAAQLRALTRRVRPRRLRAATQKRKGGTDPTDRARAVKRTKTQLADRELEMAPDAITAPRAPVFSGARAQYPLLRLRGAARTRRARQRRCCRAGRASPLRRRAARR
jgi:hypothetical protein